MKNNFLSVRGFSKDFEIIDNFRLVAFQHPLSNYGQKEMKKVLEMRSVRFARSVGDFRMLKDQDQEKVKRIRFTKK